jgi:hypothetical protein
MGRRIPARDGVIAPADRSRRSRPVAERAFVRGSYACAPQTRRRDESRRGTQECVRHESIQHCNWQRRSRWGGRPSSAPDPGSGSTNALKTEADAGVGRGPGGPPHLAATQDTSSGALRSGQFLLPGVRENNSPSARRPGIAPRWRRISLDLSRWFRKASPTSGA